ncbi:TrmB family transcriptional regulator [Enterococcus gallinarum]|uniref:Helix-turn-helix domain-containing protein n=1 Tax=Enterococcus gallinarum TaxID=1353 RepID=A0A366U458_ENTGA|nr:MULTISPECIES: helix-turn-helix domain-containing protein [Enterococcus]MBM6740213.1 TrmB family transcriptional regulator [Enterococcus gallinarum]MBO6419872.1 TrmB family transcriptional regulator [Enterococcus gallinarum]MBO6423536.1 TrmB family transcriptional regulator [Enterococcus gallinarum]MDT2688275.1 helix-turn-helix domain-containing protein [Enterococcus gallinarum]MDT2691387.1 helix-turn-helix domain-containing protein [Enterococcus gallinarum]
METIIQIMKKYDFSEMETRVYTTLLEKGNLTGYEVSKVSGVPRSKVYNILEKLLKKNLIVVNKSEPKLYHAISANEFLEKLEKSVKNDLSFLTQNLGMIKEKDEEEMLWKVDGVEYVLDKAEHLVKNAKESLLIQVWHENLTDSLLKTLQQAEKRVDKFVLILFSSSHEYDLPLEKYYIHGFETDKLADFGARWINIVADEQEVVFGTINEELQSTDVTWTKNHAMVNLAKEYVKHDAYTLKVIAESSEELKAKYGEDFEGIRKIY